MKIRLSLIILSCLSLLLSGCTTTADRIYTVCRYTPTNVYVYNGKGEFFTYDNGKVTPCATGDLQSKPKLSLVFSEIKPYTLTEQFPSVYSGTKDDVVNYIATLLKEDNAMVTTPNVDWNSFDAIVKCDEYELRIMFDTSNTVRLYAIDSEGVVINPPRL